MEKKLKDFEEKQAIDSYAAKERSIADEDSVKVNENFEQRQRQFMINLYSPDKEIKEDELKETDNKKSKFETYQSAMLEGNRRIQGIEKASQERTQLAKAKLDSEEKIELAVDFEKMDKGKRQTRILKQMLKTANDNMELGQGSEVPEMKQDILNELSKIDRELFKLRRFYSRDNPDANDEIIMNKIRPKALYEQTWNMREGYGGPNLDKEID